MLKEQLKQWLVQPAPVNDACDQIRRSPSTPLMLSLLRRDAPDLATLPQTPYTLYREFERNGKRDDYQRVYFAKRSMLTRAVMEMITGDDSMRDVIQDVLWSICEETTWVLPAHEEQGPDYWELKPSPRSTP